MEVRVLLFGPERDQLGRSEVCVQLDAPHCTCADLRARLAESQPSLAAALRTARFAVNHSFAPDAQPIAPGDEVALIGLVSGG